MNIEEAKIYVGTYGKYNDCSLEGAWMNLSDYSDKDEFLQACAELHSDECDSEGNFQGELMFQDWEEIPEFLIGESWVDERVWDLIDESSKTKDFDAFLSYIEYNSLKDLSVSEMIDRFNDDFVGCYDSEEDFAIQFAEECDEIPDRLYNYIDWSAYARDLFLGGGYYFLDSMVFRSY